MTIGFVFLGFGLLILLWVMSIYNGLVRKKNEVENTMGTIDVMLKKRFDLIPNLVETIKQYTNYESGTLEKVIALRQQVLDKPQDVSLKSDLSRTMQGMMVQVEAYPTLQASENFQQLQRALNETEEQLSAARRTYNASVTDYNNSIETFPNNMIASSFNHYPMDVLETATEEKANVNIKQLFNGQ